MITIIGVPTMATKDMKQVRVFVRGAYYKYGECSQRALQNALKHDSRLRVTFSTWKPSVKDKNDVLVNTKDQLVHIREILRKKEAV